MPVHDLITREIPKVVVPPQAGPSEPIGAPEERRGTHRSRPSTGAQFAKLAGLGIAASLLCGSVAFGSMINQRRAGESATGAPRAAAITGAQALLPDQLNETLPPPDTTAPTTNAPPATQDVEQRNVPATNEDADENAESSAAVLPGLTDTQIVERFYQLLSTAPADAFTLVAPELLHADLAGFLDSWSTVDQIEVLSLTEQADGVLAVVRMHLTDGSQLRVRQLLSVADDPRQISGAELLSAQRN